MPARGAQSAEETCAPDEARWRTAFRLLRTRKRIQFLFLALGRIVDKAKRPFGRRSHVLAVSAFAGALARSRTIVDAGDNPFGGRCCAILVVARAAVDIYSSRLVFDSIQNLYNDFLLRLTKGYGQMRWIRFAQRNRSELSNHALNTAPGGRRFLSSLH